MKPSCPLCPLWFKNLGLFDTVKAFCVALACAALLAAPAAAQAVEHGQHSFSRAEKWAQVFDDPARDEWQKPDEVIRALKLAPEALVADIGAGTGYFAVRFARAVPKGRVYGADTEPDMVRYLAERAQREKLGNLTAVPAKPDDPGIPAAVDLAILVDTYHHVSDRERYFTNLQKSLKPKGRLAIIDFTLDSPVGPPKRARIPADKVKQELARAGYKLVQEHAFLPNQYFLVFRPQKQ
ncbi:MAG: class I SAM-dependent methyltransferase [Betaproteobacteria bacterium]|nr:class I SAM-dependent methyltransferase [Betaproteobacteria bacterium]